MMIPKMLTWNDRFALIDKFEPNDNTILVVFGVSNTELSVARNLRTVGTFIPAKHLDYESYAPAFSSNKKQEQVMTEQPVETTDQPETATKKLLKRGRKGNNIATAFTSVPFTPVKAEAFAMKYKVSMAVLRQSKRFDTAGLPGAVRVKKDKDSGELMVWREQTA